MKIRYKDTKQMEWATSFTVDTPKSVATRNGPVLICDVEVYLESEKKWKDMSQAFADHDLITDQYNVFFQEPNTPEDRERGYVVWN